MEKRTLFRKKRQIPLWNLVWEFTFRKTVNSQSKFHSVSGVEISEGKQRNSVRERPTKGRDSQGKQARDTSQRGIRV